MISRRLTTPILSILTLICFYAASYNSLLLHQKQTNRTRQISSGVWSLPPLALLAVAGEFKGLTADYLTMEIGAQLGTELVRTPEGGFRTVKKQRDWPAIHRLFEASQTLDPSFAQTFNIAQGWLPFAPANMIAETQEILKIASQNRPWDWHPAHFRGFNTYFFFNDLGEAGKIYLEAAKTPNAPPFLSIIGARLAQQGEQTEAAIAMMQSMLIDKTPDDPDYADIFDRFNALKGVLVIKQAVNRYKKDIGQKPISLKELTTTGILASLPPNPYGLKYCMDADNIIYFDKPDCQ